MEYKQPPMTKDQKFYKIDGRLKSEIDVYVTEEDTVGEKNPPSIAACRHAVLEINNGSHHPAYVIYDRLLCRIVNGVYYMSLEDVLECAREYNNSPEAWQSMMPNGVALGLKYPKQKGV